MPALRKDMMGAGTHAGERLVHWLTSSAMSVKGFCMQSLSLERGCSSRLIPKFGLCEEMFGANIVRLNKCPAMGRYDMFNVRLSYMEVLPTRRYVLHSAFHGPSVRSGRYLGPSLDTILPEATPDEPCSFVAVEVPGLPEVLTQYVVVCFLCILLCYVLASSAAACTKCCNMRCMCMSAMRKINLHANGCWTICPMYKPSICIFALCFAGKDPIRLQKRLYMKQQLLPLPDCRAILQSEDF